MASVSQSFCSLKPTKKNYTLASNPKNLFAFKNFKRSSSLGASNPESSPNSQENPPESAPPDADPLKLAFAKAKAYKNSKISNSSASSTVQSPVQKSFAEVNTKNNSDAIIDEIKDTNEEKEVSVAVKFESENNSVADTGGVADGGNETFESGLKGSTVQSVGDEKSKKNELKISSIDFVGLDFSDKKKRRGLPPGLVPMNDTFAEGKLPEVEILIGDRSKFEDSSAASYPIPTKEVEDDDDDVYKPKVSTWGVFPRPSNISKAYGGGRTIRPGEALETAEERAAKQERTRKLLAAYKGKTGRRIDPKLKNECEEALRDGDSLLDLGKLKEALPFYEKVMEKLDFETELYGSAALQWSICQDSLRRPNEARKMYEKLQSHPNAQVRKKAKQFVFSFQAMEFMKVKSSTRSYSSTDYQTYFEAFVEKNTSYPMQDEVAEEGALGSAVLYIIFLVSPMLIVFLLAAFRN